MYKIIENLFCEKSQEISIGRLTNDQIMTEKPKKKKRIFFRNVYKFYLHIGSSEIKFTMYWLYI